MPNQTTDRVSENTGFKAIDQAALAAEAKSEREEVDARTIGEAVASRIGPDLPPQIDSNATSHEPSAGLSGLPGEWLKYLADGALRNGEAIAQLLLCRSPQDVVRVQTDMVKGNVLAAVTGASRIGTATLQAMRAITKPSTVLPLQ